METPGSVNVYTTFAADADWKAFARTLLSERLAACVNAAPITSMYWWEGRIAEDAEVALVFKTTKARAPALMGRIAALHPYDTPCVEVLEVAEVDERYSAWMREETRA